MPALDERQERQLTELIGAGQLIQAIKLYRELTGVGLKEAKDAVDARRFGQPGTPSGAAETEGSTDRLASAEPDSAAGLSPEHEREIRGLVASGDKISAIRRHRELTGASLSMAKDAVEALQGVSDGAGAGSCARGAFVVRFHHILVLAAFMALPLLLLRCR